MSRERMMSFLQGATVNDAPGEQRCYREVFTDPGGVALKPLNDRRQPDLICPEHRAALVPWPAISIKPDDVDVRGALGDIFFEDFRAFIDHRVQRSRDDLVRSEEHTSELQSLMRISYA